MEYLTHEEKVALADSKVEALKAESSKLKKDLISVMEERNTSLEKVKTLAKELRVKKLLTMQKDKQLQSANQKIKTIVAKAMQAFKLTEEYNNVLFSWQFKGFKLLKRFLTKHNLGVDLESLDFEAIDKEKKASEAFKAIAATAAMSNASLAEDDAPVPVVGEDAPTA